MSEPTREQKIAAMNTTPQQLAAELDRLGGDNGGTWGPTVPGLAPWAPGHLFDHLPDAY